MTEPPDSRPKLPVTAAFATVITILVGFVQAAFLLAFRDVSSAATPAIMGMATIVAFGYALFLAASRIPNPPAFHLGLVRPPAIAWTAVLFLASSLLLVSEVDNLFKRLFPLPEAWLEAERELPAGALYALSLTLVFAVVRPVAQELLFRGFMQPHFVRRWGPIAGIGFTSLLNGLAFFLLNPWSFASVFALSLVLGTVRHSCRSLLPALTLHALFGITTVLATYGVFGIDGFDNLDAPHTPLGWLAPAALLSGIGFGLCRAAAASPPPEAPPSGAPSL